MVSAKQGNKRRNRPNTKRFRPGGNVGVARNTINGGVSRMNAMFSASQIPDNPGYVDFNEPTIQPIQQQQQPQHQQIQHSQQSNIPSKNKPNKNNRLNRRDKNQKGGGRNIGRNSLRNQPNSNSWSAGGNRISGQSAPLPPLPPPPNRNFRNQSIPGRLGIGGGRPMPMPPVGGMGMRPPPMLPPPMPMQPAGRYGPRPLLPPHMGGMPPVPPPLLPPRLSRGLPMRGGPLPPPRPLMAPRGVPPVGPGPIRRNKAIRGNRKNEIKNNRNRRAGNNSGGVSGGQAKTAGKTKNVVTKKTLNEIINQYPLDKPWVTDEIREEHKKKQEIEDKLKGNRDDNLFAEFKVQRDKFVNLYEAARLEFIGKHPEQDVEKIMTESDKMKAENSNANVNQNDKTNTTVAAASVVQQQANNVVDTKLSSSSTSNENSSKANNNKITDTVVNSNEQTKANISNINKNKNNDEQNIKQKPVEKPKPQQQANKIQTPKAVPKPRQTRSNRGRK